MDHERAPILRSKDQKKTDMPLALVSEESNIILIPAELKCFSVSTSRQENITLESKERQKSASQLSGLIIFYLVVMLVEIVGGMKANSLAVLTDAAHLLTDVAGFSISLFTVWASAWKATSNHSFGFSRLEVLGALISVQLIWLVSALLIYEALSRLLHDKQKNDLQLNSVKALFGLQLDSVKVTSTLKTKILNINLQGAYLHVMADLIQSVGVMIAGAVIWLKPNWLIVDLLCTLIFSTFALSTTLPMLRDVFDILMGRTPRDINIDMVEDGIKGINGVESVHDLHVWAITVGKLVLSCHVVAKPGVESKEMISKIRDYCESTYKIHHITVQIEQL
ncbi:hypothetical protein GOBAR_AA12916 [Gossypium barbadense]|uniref:Cation efflux protein cytoplasmic domain-containing protein n=1 Tax=Gossypium barbadense TaxID=3634 RepID=A0A2P5XWH7_GOSBA|nr:hypothetical protein GOBAR_AA12916 [Gossypium barbadense]